MRGSTLALALALAAAPVEARAQDFESARAMGLGGSLRALSVANDTLYLNPAGMALGTTYSVEANYLDDLHGSDHVFNASIVDSQAGPIAGGLGYTFSRKDLGKDERGDLRRVGHRAELALATRIAETLALGVTGRYLNVADTAGDSDTGNGFDLFTLDAGLTWRSSFGLAAGVAGYNLTNPTAEGVPIGWGAGLGFEAEGFTIEGDVRYNARVGKAAFSGGLGYSVAGVVPLRVGVAYDLLTESLTVSGGAGFFTKEFGVDVGYRQRAVHGTLSPDDKEDRMLGLSLRIAFM